MAKEVVGQWSAVFSLSNVAVHASLLPNGKVLYFGRRSNPKTDPRTNLPSLDEHLTKAFILDPATRKSVPTANEPLGADNKPVNLFCAGHSFLPDGTVFIVGGHLKDGVGANQACVYDPRTNRFTPKALMNGGRWYPSTITLPDGRVFAISGSVATDFHPNNIPQIWPSDSSHPNTWAEVTDPFVAMKEVLHLYPRLHISPRNGQIFMSGPQAKSWFLRVKDDKGADVRTNKTIGIWSDATTARSAGVREYSASVMYDSGKVMYIGGGGDNASTPTNVTEFIDLNSAAPKWTTSGATNMKYPRGQFNATVLPDGTVLVTGGTKGPQFNNLDPANVVHQSELWDPIAKKWKEMAAESRDRCYHSTALLLPDGRVLSAGGGEYGGCTLKDCLTDAQLFEPPYLFKGGRPTIKTAPAEISYGKEFPVTLGSSDPIDRVSWVRLGSVTHCCNMNQSLMFLRGFKQTGVNLAVPAPANASLAPPGHYMLFVLNKQGVPSVAPIIHVSSPAAPRPAAAAVHTTEAPTVQPTSLETTVAPTLQPTLLQHAEKITAEQERPPVIVGLTPVCPYGLGPCWAGAYNALHRVNDISVVRPVAHQEDSVAFVYLKQDILPDIDIWRKEFANDSYDMRGIEMTVSGTVVINRADGCMTLAGTSTRPQLTLAPFQESSQVRWNVKTKKPKPISEAEIGAYKRLSSRLADHPTGVGVKVIGTLRKRNEKSEFSLDVRDFEVF